MYVVINTKTGKAHEYKTLAQASNGRDRMDRAYGAICTTYPTFCEDKAAVSVLLTKFQNR